MPVDMMFRRMELRWPREVRLASLLVAPRASETCGAGNRFHDYSLLLCRALIQTLCCADRRAAPMRHSDESNYDRVGTIATEPPERHGS